MEKRDPAADGILGEGDQLLGPSDAQKKLALVKAGSRPEHIAEAEAKRDAAAAFIEEGKAELDQCAVRAPAAGTVRVVATVGEFVSVLTQAPLLELTPEASGK